MKLKEFIALYSQGRRDAELELDDFINAYDAGAFEAYYSVDDMIAALSSHLDKEVTYDERRTCQDVEVDVYVDGHEIFSIAAMYPVCEWEL